MSSESYERLGFLDSSFILAETPTNHMHVGSVGIFEAGSLRTPEGGIDIDRIRAFAEAKLAYLERYRQVVTLLPITRHPAWVDDPHFNIHYHVRHSALPRPGDERQLKRLTGRIMSQQLDRRRPLWELWIVEGLDGGDRFAMIVKIHHSMVDGMTGVDLLMALLAPAPTDAFEPAKRWTPRPVPPPWELLKAEARHFAQGRSELSAYLRERRAEGREARADAGAVLNTARDTARKILHRVSSTSLNQPIGPHRRFDWLRMDLSQVKAAGKALGGSVNDIVLATVTFAVRRFLEGRGERVDGLDFRVMTPVSTRSAAQRGAPGVRVSGWIRELPLAERDPRGCVARIHETTHELKETRQAQGAELIAKAISWTPAPLLGLATRVAERSFPFNLVVTNVPGPPVPLYLLGARMIDSFGLLPLTDYLGLGIVIFSYAGELTWGFIADWDLVPDLHDLVLATEEAFREIRRAAEAVSINEGTHEA